MECWIEYSPIVGDISSNKSSVKRSKILDLPTPLSPMSRSYTMARCKRGLVECCVWRRARCGTRLITLTLNWWSYCDSPSITMLLQMRPLVDTTSRSVARSACGSFQRAQQQQQLNGVALDHRQARSVLLPWKLPCGFMHRHASVESVESVLQVDLAQHSPARLCRQDSCCHAHGVFEADPSKNSLEEDRSLALTHVWRKRIPKSVGGNFKPCCIIVLKIKFVLKFRHWYLRWETEWLAEPIYNVKISLWVLWNIFCDPGLKMYTQIYFQNKFLRKFRHIFGRDPDQFFRGTHTSPQFFF